MNSAAIRTMLKIDVDAAHAEALVINADIDAIVEFAGDRAPVQMDGDVNWVFDAAVAVWNARNVKKPEGKKTMKNRTALMIVIAAIVGCSYVGPTSAKDNTPDAEAFTFCEKAGNESAPSIMTGTRKALKAACLLGVTARINGMKEDDFVKVTDDIVEKASHTADKVDATAQTATAVMMVEGYIYARSNEGSK